MTEQREVPKILIKRWKRQRRGAFIAGFILIFALIPFWGLCMLVYMSVDHEGVRTYNQAEQIYITDGTITKVEDKNDIRTYTYNFKRPDKGVVEDHMYSTLDQTITYRKGDKVSIEFTDKNSGIHGVKTPSLTELSKMRGERFTPYLVIFSVLMVLSSPFIVFGLFLIYFSGRVARKKIKLHRSGIFAKGKIVDIRDIVGKKVVAYEFTPASGNMLFREQQVIVNLAIIEGKKAGDAIDVVYSESRPDRNALYEIGSVA